MADADSVRRIMQEEELQFRAALSENLFFGVGENINFIANFQHNRHDYHLNGDYPIASGQTGIDGVFHCFKNIEVVGYSFYIGDVGISGATTIDIHEILGNGTDNGSIFTTLPSVDATTAANFSTSSAEYFLGTENQISTPTGHTIAVFDRRTFSAGTSLRLDLDAAASSGADAQFTLIYRPLN